MNPQELKEFYEFTYLGEIVCAMSVVFLGGLVASDLMGKCFKCGPTLEDELEELSEAVTELERKVEVLNSVMLENSEPVNLGGTTSKGSEGGASSGFRNAPFSPGEREET